MKWPWEIDDNRDGQPDDRFGDTYMELFVAWIALCLTFLVVATIIHYIGG